VVSQREGQPHERRLPRAWTRRIVVTAGVALIGWLLLGESLAEGASVVPGDPAVAALIAASAMGAGKSSSVRARHLDPVLLVPGPSQDIPGGIASNGSGHGTVDRDLNVSTDTSRPLAVAPQLCSGFVAASRSRGQPGRATWLVLSPD
jgi:hypothetical protein